MSTTIDIKKAKLIEDATMELEYTETITPEEGPKVTLEWNLKNKHLVHDDLKNAFSKMVLHMAVICEIIDPMDHYIEELPAIYPKLLGKLSVTGISIGGQDEYRGVTIIGRRKLDGGKVLNLVAPFTNFFTEHNSYAFESDLHTDTEKVISEVIEYLNGKHKPNPQLELELQ